MLFIEVGKKPLCENCLLEWMCPGNYDYQADLQTIESNLAKLVEAYNEGDLDGVLPFYNYDLVTLRQGNSPQSKAEVAWRLSETFNKFDTLFEVETEEIAVSGELAFTRGIYRMTFTFRNKRKVKVIERRFLTIWKKVNEDWLIFRSMDNFT